MLSDDISLWNITLKAIYMINKRRDITIDKIRGIISPRKYEIAEVTKNAELYNKF
jgi:hypothetical protein